MSRKRGSVPAPGLRFCLFISTYELLIALKIVELTQPAPGEADPP